jgi:hypothetical protein
MDMKETVKDEINVMVKEAGGTHPPTDEDIFKYRTAAAKRVFLSLSLDKQAEILRKIEEGGDIVPNDIKQQ